MMKKKYTAQIGYFDTCIEIPPRVYSDGIFNETLKDTSDAMMKNTLPGVELSLVVIFLTSQAFHVILAPLRLPKLVPQILAGLFLAFVSSKSNRVIFKKDQLFSPDSQEILETLGSLGYILFMFQSSVKMDLDRLLTTGRKAVTIGVPFFTCPLIIGFMLLCGLTNSKRIQPLETKKLIDVLVSQSFTHFPVISNVIFHMNLQNSDLGRIGLSASLISDIIQLTFINGHGLIKIYKLTGNIHEAALYLLATLCYVVFVFLVVRPFMFWIIKQTPEGRPIKDVYVYTIIIVALGSGLPANYNKTYRTIILWPYIFGLAVPAGPPLGSAIAQKLDCFVLGIFLPLFVTITAVKVDLGHMAFNNVVINYSLAIVILIFCLKFITCIVSCFLHKMVLQDSIALALIMTSKGAVDISVYSNFRDKNSIPQDTFTLLMMSTLCLTITAPTLVGYLYDSSRKYLGYQKRNIMHLKRNSEVRILACVQRINDIPSILDLLDASQPKKDSPIYVYVLHLIELVGRSSPIFISHRIQKKTSSDLSYSENVILSFNRFERNYISGAATVDVFTSVSPPKSMHEDICTLALDKLTSFIILPFHRKWLENGEVELDDNMARALNNNVLQLAPCSVGILMHRGSTMKAVISSDDCIYSICMVFLGGQDDREGLVYAKRMARGSNTSLTVIQFVPSNEQDDPRNSWQRMLDDEVLRDIKHSSVDSELTYVSYVEEVVKDGSELASIVRSLMVDYNLIICGRRIGVECPQTTGLVAMSEFPELGAIGDLLASSDIYGKASALVVQQQITNT